MKWAETLSLFFALATCVSGGKESTYVNRYESIILSNSPLSDDSFGASMALMPDVDDNSVMDFAVGAPMSSVQRSDDEIRKYVGLVVIFHMEKSGKWRKKAGYEMISGDDFNLGFHAQFGSALATVRDLQNDSYYELAVSAPNVTGGGVVVLVNSTGEAGNSTVLRTSDVGLQGDSSNFGYSLASGVFVNGSGSYDLIAGDPMSFNGAGSISFISLNSSGSAVETWTLLASDVLVFESDIPSLVGSSFGAAVAALPDLDSDGENEVLVGLPDYNGAQGAVILLYVNCVDRSVKSSVLITPDDFSNTRVTDNCRFGAAVSHLGRQGENVMIAVGAPGNGDGDDFEAGAVIILTLNPAGEILSSFRIMDLTKVEPVANDLGSPFKQRWLGSSVAGLSDLNEDGKFDILIGAPGAGCCGSVLELFMEPGINYAEITSTDDADDDDFWISNPIRGRDDDDSSSSESETRAFPMAEMIIFIGAFWSFFTCTYVIYKLLVNGIFRRHVSNRVRGLSQTQIRQLAVTRYHRSSSEETTEPDACSICLTDFSEGDQIKKLSCRHMYHPGCIDIWLATSSKCPLCQQNPLEAHPISNFSQSAPVADSEIELQSIESSDACDITTPVDSNP